MKRSELIKALMNEGDVNDDPDVVMEYGGLQNTIFHVGLEDAVMVFLSDVPGRKVIVLCEFT